MFEIIVQRAISDKSCPTTTKLKRWVLHVLKNKIPSSEVTLRIVDKKEIMELNSTYRKKNKPTNVLSFPFDMPEGCENELPILGDILLCAAVIDEEAKAQGKTLESHWAHMVVHGTLHLLGYDHEKETDAAVMEAEEIKLLNELGFENPYYIDEGENK